MQILVIDADKADYELLKSYFINDDFLWCFHDNFGSAFSYLEKNRADLILINISTPLIVEWDACETIKEYRMSPVILIYGSDTVENKVMAFRLGADDYIAKPFKPGEVAASLKSRLKIKNDNLKSAEKALKVEDTVVDINRHEVLIKDRVVNLRPKELKLLHFMLKNRNIVFTREQLMKKVWGYNAFCDIRTVDIHVNRLRTKLYDKNSSWKIKTVWGVGYVLKVFKNSAASGEGMGRNA